MWDDMLKNTKESLGLFIRAWRGETLLNKAGMPRKRDAKESPELAQYCALGCRMFKALKESGNYADDVLEQVQNDIVSQCLWLH